MKKQQKIKLGTMVMLATACLTQYGLTAHAAAHALQTQHTHYHQHHHYYTPNHSTSSTETPLNTVQWREQESFPSYKTQHSRMEQQKAEYASINPQHANKLRYSNQANSAHSTNSTIETIDINSADAKSLATLKGIGIKKAEAIVSYRQTHGQFSSIQDLTRVKGLGQKALDRLLKNNPDQITARQ